MATAQARLSLVNAAATATITATTEAAGWPASNMQRPQAPFEQWRSTNKTLHEIVVDFGAATPIGLVVLVDVNFQTPGIDILFEDSIMGGGTPAVVATPEFNAWNRRYSYAWAPSPVGNRRYLRVQINTSTTTDGAAYFRVGGIWAGPLAGLFRDIRWDEEMLTVEPSIDLQPSHQSWRQRLRMGDPYTVIRARRIAVTANGAAAGVNAELDHWLLIDHYMWGQDAFAWFSNRGKAAEAWIMRRISEAAWPIHQTVSEGGLVMEEITGP